MPPLFPRLLDLQSGIVRCHVCGELAHRKGDGFAIHIPKNTTRPCPTSWGAHATKVPT